MRQPLEILRDRLYGLDERMDNWDPDRETIQSLTDILVSVINHVEALEERIQESRED